MTGGHYIKVNGKSKVLFMIYQRCKFAPLRIGKEEPVALTTYEGLGAGMLKWRVPNLNRWFVVARTREEALDKFHDEKNWSDEKLGQESQKYLNG